MHKNLFSCAQILEKIMRKNLIRCAKTCSINIPKDRHPLVGGKTVEETLFRYNRFY